MAILQQSGSQVAPRAPPTTTQQPITFVQGNVGEGSCPSTQWKTLMERDLNRRPFSYWLIQSTFLSYSLWLDQFRSESREKLCVVETLIMKRQNKAVVTLTRTKIKRCWKSFTGSGFKSYFFRPPPKTEGLVPVMFRPGSAGMCVCRTAMYGWIKKRSQSSLPLPPGWKSHWSDERLHPSSFSLLPRISLLSRLSLNS